VALSARDIQSRIVPSPKQLTLTSGDVTLDPNWRISFAGQLKNEAQILADELAKQGLSLALSDAEYGDQRIVLSINPALKKPESYRVEVSSKGIQIQGHDAAGVFYGVQSLLSLTASSKTVPQLHIDDEPRYSWRGMHYDMARNFHGVPVTKRLIEQMGRYKLNKLHLHLSEDEGWRLEIPGLPELTDIGGQRCFDLTEQRCLLTQLGTGPHKTGSGNGFYRRAEFIELLQYAAARHIEVIPEFDMPGHARAAVKAMEARYHTLKKAGNLAAAQQYLLSDPQDKSRYLTVQSYTDNSVNVCLDSSYAFVDKLVYELQQMYREAMKWALAAGLNPRRAKPCLPKVNRVLLGWPT
jgi:hexosaminidase